jgi:hypothetical protein
VVVLLLKIKTENITIFSQTKQAVSFLSSQRDLISQPTFSSSNISLPPIRIHQLQKVFGSLTIIKFKKLSLTEYQKLRKMKGELDLNICVLTL